MSPISTPAILASVRDLPTLPAVVMELIQSLGSETTGAEKLARDIARDAALSAKILRLANSSLYGMSRRVTSIGDAAAILGMRSLRCMVTAAGLSDSFKPSACAGFDFKGFWRHTLATALLARSVARQRQLEEETAFTLGLLHDIGRLALACHFPASTADALRYQHEQDCPSLQAERIVLETDHCIVGGLIAEHWNFSAALVEAIRGHHEPPTSYRASLTDVVHVADNMAHALDLAQSPDELVPPLSMAAWMRLGLDDVRCQTVFREAEAEHESVCAALSL